MYHQFSSAQTGAYGEDCAVDYLRQRGYMLLSRNWRIGHYELDIVCGKEGILHFVEVKTRQAGALTTPEDALTRSKQQALRRAAEAYLSYTHYDLEIQFDLIAVEMEHDACKNIRLIENAVEYNW